MMTVFSGRTRKHCTLLSSVGRNVSPPAGEVIIPVSWEHVALLSVPFRHVLTGRERTVHWVCIQLFSAVTLQEYSWTQLNPEKQRTGGDGSVTLHACITVCIQAMFDMGCGV